MAYLFLKYSKPRLIVGEVNLLTSILTADGTPLKDSLRKADRGRRVKAFLLVAPLLLFVLVSFVFPIFEMLFRSVDNPVVARNLPLTIEKLQKWDGNNLPDQAVFSSVAKNLKRQAY